MDRETYKYYKILEVEYGASLEEIKSAYRHLVIVWHPDRMPQNNLELINKANNKLKAINDAYAKLISISNKTKKNTNKQQDYSTSSSNKNEDDSKTNKQKENKYKNNSSKLEVKYVLKFSKEIHRDWMNQIHKFLIFFVLPGFILSAFLVYLYVDFFYFTHNLEKASYISPIVIAYMYGGLGIIVSIGEYVIFWLKINRFKKITANNEYAMIINHQSSRCNIQLLYYYKT